MSGALPSPGPADGSSLVARLFLVMILAGATLAGLTWWLHSTLAERAVSRAGLDRIVDRLALPLIALNEAAPGERADLARTMILGRRPVRRLDDAPDVSPLPNHALADALRAKVADSMAGAGIDHYVLGFVEASSREWPLPQAHPEHHRRHMENLDDGPALAEPEHRAGPRAGQRPGQGRPRRDLPILVLAIPLADGGGWIASGTVLAIHGQLAAGEPPTYPFTIGAIALVIALALWAVWQTSRPLRQFTLAAERLGRDVNAQPLDDQRGPREVRQAAMAFNRMQERIRGFIDTRTRMLAAISHDLRTPITRLRLRAELVEDEDQRTRMLADLDEMETMIAATLAFIRDDVAEEKSRRLDLAALVQAVVDDAVETGAAVTYKGPDSLPFEGRPLGLKRALSNLIDNGAKYASHTQVCLAHRDGTVVVSVTDDGPGIPENHLPRVFDPFYRVEASRSRDTGGSGLGLSVVQTVATAHGGSIELTNRLEGGLLARITLPLAKGSAS